MSSDEIAEGVKIESPEQPTAYEEIIEIYLRDVDRTLIRANLALTPAQRLQKLEEFVEFLQSAKQSHRSS